MISIVLMYHDIYIVSGRESGFQNESALQYKIHVGEFERHVMYCREFMDENPEYEIRFTFDDGGVSFYTLAAPILEKYNLRGVFFISTKYIGTPLFLSWAQIKELKERGHTIGSHSHSHPVLPSLSETDIALEWNTSVGELNKRDVNMWVASIPNGDCNKEVIQKAKEAGFKTLYTSIPTTKEESCDRMQIVGRYVIYQGMSANEVIAIIANKRKRDRIYARWLFLRVVKSALGDKYSCIKQLFFRRK